MSELPIIQRVLSFQPDQAAILDREGSHPYQELSEVSARVAGMLLNGDSDLNGKCVAYLVPPSFDYTAVLLGVWRAGGIAVPLCLQHPAHELAYVIEDSNAEIIVAHPEFKSILLPLAQKLGRRFLFTTDIPSRPPEQLPQVAMDRGAIIIYTSGTTSKPKGVLSTHLSLTAQITNLVEAWEWSASDRSILVLPLHHIHGIVNVLCCSLWAGARCEMLRGFDANQVWERIRNDKLSVLMAVPTIYTRLIAVWESATEGDRTAMSNGCRRLRLMVSGSAALPVSVFEQWREISGHALLERYGMTETGMALSNPLHGKRLPGHVGSPLPRVQVRLVDEAENLLPDDVPGEIQIRGSTVFREYWRKPDATTEAFTPDGWFRTGDIASRHRDVYRILGRNSVDIIKTGGYKVSALEIEEELLNHPAICQCAVVGVPDVEWGERVAAAIVLKADTSIDLSSLRTWAKDKLALYKIPSLLQVVSDLPRNAIGKVVKPEVSKFFPLG